jgi:tetratricopeptide (TPR) repeat protein
LVSEHLKLDVEAMRAHEKVIGLGRAQASNYFRLGVLCAKANRVEPAIDNIARAVELEPDKYRQILREELKKVHSHLDREDPER